MSGKGYFLFRAHEGQPFAQVHLPPLSHGHLSLPQAEHFMSKPPGLILHRAGTTVPTAETT